MNKREARLKRAKRTRFKIREIKMVRLCVHRTSKHIYAQITSSDGSQVFAFAATVEKEFKSNHAATGNIAAATEIGKLIAKRAIGAGIQKVAFDRSGYHYHGRVQALATAARESGLEI